MEPIHKTIFRRTLVACAFLSILAGGAGFLSESVPKGSGARHSAMEEGRKLSVAAILAALGTALVLYPVFAHMNRRQMRFADDVLTGNLELASVLGAAIAQRDSDTGSHNFRVTLYAFHLAETLHAPDLDLRPLLLGAFLHDVGKIGIPDAILLKPGKLTPGEMEVMRSHVERGAEIIGTSTWLQLARTIIECHHERFDGTGYPRGLAGEAIPLVARIFAIVDVFDALTSERPYKKAMPLDPALEVLRQEAGAHFDPALVEAFGEVAPRAYEEIHPASERVLMTLLEELLTRHRQTLYSPMPHQEVVR